MEWRRRRRRRGSEGGGGGDRERGGCRNCRCCLLAVLIAVPAGMLIADICWKLIAEAEAQFRVAEQVQHRIRAARQFSFFSNKFIVCP
ncbi:hypothetical protein LSTR_LSTR008959 [Laodelphax striatellus]|uniref:Uncharacterized protein n=1 Tax=Laodelphax striatellus TaxID=195883 RepID=A0A482WKR2_LAOST|nr:hypothetical protein LSTR_LSTR008959 [Laodelphax striatellus]